MRDIQDFASLKIKLASPDTIRKWSYGEVKKPETINYRTLRPEKEGLFCERIFGTTKEWECFCGKFKSIRYKGVICDRCGVEVTHFKVRRERTGHIELAAPVSHIWYYRTAPGRIAQLLDLKQGELRSVLYYESYIVIDPGDTDLKRLQILSEEEYEENKERYGESFTADMGAEAIKTLLENLDLDALAMELRGRMKEKGAKSDKKLLKRIEIIEDFRSSGNKASWMILDVVPVIPPELRPMVQLDGGRFATSDLNDLYRRVINRNNRLRRLLQLAAPDIIIRNEKRMLQEAVDALFDNSKHKRVVKGASNRPLKSISDMLKGKQGRFRQNLLGKRVDYSGRSVIVVGPELKLWQCGLPTKMALELFKPFIMKKLVDKSMAMNIKKAKMKVEAEEPEVYAILDEVVREHPVMLNRAPTLHRLGIQAFEPVLVEGKALKLHPLACKAFNADFDGDQMAVHVPLTQAAQMECWTLMLSARNLLDPANGNTIVYPSQDMVLGIYYMTAIKPNAKGANKDGKPNMFSSPDEVRMAAETGNIEWQAEITLHKDTLGKKIHNDPEPENPLVKTSAGRLAFNEEMPAAVEYYNEQMNDKKLKTMIEDVYHEHGSWLTIQMLDAIKAVGYKNATFYGATLCMDDIIIPEEKKKLVEEANKDVEDIHSKYTQGLVSAGERFNQITNRWRRANEELSKKMMDNFKSHKDGFNTIFMMADSGARGSPKQISQLAGMRGLMTKPDGGLIELPIRSNFKEGLSVIEFFISTNGARKGLSDTALKTAEAGYMTRRLVDVAQDVVVTEEDCGTINGIEYEAIKNGDEILVHLADRIVGHYTIERVLNHKGEELCGANCYIDKKLAKLIEDEGVEKVRLRTVLTCEARHGVCVKCYGQNLARNKVVEIGEAVGIVAAQSIGQPGTQLTLRTFHSGGTAEGSTKDNNIVLKYPALIKGFGDSHTYLKHSLTLKLKNGNEETVPSLLFTRKGALIVSRVLDRYTFDKTAGDKVQVKNDDVVTKGDIVIKKSDKSEVAAVATGTVLLRDGVLYILGKDTKVEIAIGSNVTAKLDEIVEAGNSLGQINLFNEPIIAEQDGITRFEDIIVGMTLEEKVRVENNKRISEKTITALHLNEKQPRILVVDEDGNELGNYHLPAGALLQVEEGQKIEAGTTLATIPTKAMKTSDITSGLPRVSELFEARKPKTPCVLSCITGTVKIKNIIKGKRIVEVEDEFNHVFQHAVPTARRMLVRDGDKVQAGEPLCDGSPDPHEILEIEGENALQEYLMKEIQAVYNDQSVDINDKHIGIIVRQMLRKVKIIAVGDTKFIFGKEVDKYEFHEENARVIKEGGEPAVGRPLFQSITKASLRVESFISAASFQETTRVLTKAAIAGKRDELRGIKENVAIGHMIPAGTGIRNYKDMQLFDDRNQNLDLQMEEILARRAEEEKILAQQQLIEPMFETESDDAD